ncbi:MAG: YfhO family protein, partial [Roseburia sp.]|nr:YfhO family protein [Roseburia sp.]
LRKYDVKNIIHIAGGILYAFGAATLVHFQIMLVMDAAFLLPLLMIGIDRIFEKKGCKFFIVMFALCMIINVYTGCITLMFLFLSCGARIFWSLEDRAEKRRCALWLGVSVGTALLLSAVVSIPAFLCVSETSRNTSGDLFGTYLTAIKSSWSLRDWKTIERMFVNLALPCSCIVYFLLHGKEQAAESMKRHKGRVMVIVFMILSVFVSGIEILWHGGSRASWPLRFIYMISFVLIDLAVVLYHENKEHIADATDWLRKKAVLVIPAAAVVLSAPVFHKIYTVYCANAVYSELGDGFLCIVISLIFLSIYWYLLKSKNRGLVLALLCVEIMLSSVMSFAPNKDNVTVFSAEYLDAANHVAMSMEEEPEDFERIKNMDYEVDHIEYSLVLGQEAISNYWHVISPTLQPAFAALGYSVNWTQLLDTGGTIFTDTLFQIKYYLGDQLPEALYDYCENVETSNSNEIEMYKNKFELPFAINTNVSNLAAREEKFQTQNELFVAMTGSTEPLIEDVSDQIQNGSFTMNAGEEQKALYFYGTNTEGNPVSVTVNEEPVMIPSSSSVTNDQYPADFGNGLICLGCFQNEPVEVEFSGSTSDVHLGVFDMELFKKGIEYIKSQNPEIKSLKQKNSGLSMELDHVTRSNIFLPVSYDEGWVCKVNGKKVTELGNIDGMLSIPVEEGTNEIKLSYIAPGRTMGGILSAVTLLLFIACIVIRKKKEIQSEKAAVIAGHAAYAVFAALFTVFLIFVFVIPVLFYLRGIFIASE